MTKNRNRFIALIVAVVLVVACLPISALAGDGEGQPTAQSSVTFQHEGDVFVDQAPVTEGEALGTAIPGLAATLDTAVADTQANLGEGYEFLGWALNGATSPLYTNTEATQQVASVGLPSMVFEATFKAPETPPATTHTVTFYGANGNVHAQQQVENGSLATHPATPENDAATAFQGWYVAQDGSGSQFDFATPITGNVELYAIFSSNYLVSFKDANGDIYHTEEVASGGTVGALPENPAPGDATQAFQFWFVEKGAETAYDFTAPVYANITLVPKFDSTHYIFFDARGGTNVDMQVLQNGGKIDMAKATTDRAGYDFAFWSANPNATADQKDTEAFDFDADVTGSHTLYAVWAAKTVKYSVVYWHEVNNFAGEPGTDKKNYTYSTQVDVAADRSAIAAGQTLSEAEVKALADANYKAAAIDKATVYKTNSAYTNSPLLYSEYSFGPSVTASGDGTTVVNVYYKSIVFNVTIKLGKTGAYIETPEGTQYVSGVNDYTFKAKFQQDIRGLFPMDDWVMNSGTQVIDGWNVKNAANSFWWNHDETPHSSVSVYPEFMVPVNTHADKGGNRDITMTAVWMERSAAKYMYRQGYLELTAEERADYDAAVANGYKTPNYTSSFAYPTAPYDAKDPHPYIQYGTKIYKWYSDYVNEGYAKYKDTESSFNFWLVPGGDKAAQVLRNNASKDWTDAILYYLSDRHTYKLTLNAGDGTLPEGVNSAYNIAFGNGVENAVKLASGNSLMPAAIPNDPTGENMSFAGWYLDSGFETPFTADTVMPAGDLVLYAKYRTGTFDVTFYDKMGGSPLGEIDEAYTVYGKGETVKDPGVYELNRYYEGLGVFQGWGWFLPGTGNMQPYNYAATVSSNLELYGLWKTDGFTVRYDANGGGTAPTDNEKYKLDVLALVQGGDDLLPPAGNIFIGWQVDGAGPIYYKGTNVRITGDVKLVALYVSESTELVDINYHPNYEPTTELTQTVKALPDSEATTLGAATFSRPGYMLTGWNTQPDGTGATYNFGDPLAVEDETIDLYALWEKDPAYTVTFQVAGGQETWGSLTTTAEQDKSSIVYNDVPRNSLFSELEWPAAAPNKGYYFVGWTPANPVGMYVTADQVYEARFAKIDFVVDNKAKFYGEQDGITLENLFSYWPSGVSRSHFDISFVRVAGEDVGIYAVNVTIVPKEQYKERYNLAAVDSGWLTIKKLPVTITPNGGSKAHGDADPALTATVDYNNTEKQAPTGWEGFTPDELKYKVVREVGENTGTYEQSVASTEDGLSLDALNPNYAITLGTAPFEITQAGVVTINVASGAKTYGDADPASFADRVSVGGLTGGDTAAMLNIRVTRTAGENAGGYDYNVTWDGSDNYDEIRLGYVGNYTINPRDTVLVANSYTIPEGSDIPEFTAYVHGDYPLVNGDTTLNYSLYRTSELTTAGEYDILVRVGDNPNYNVYVVSGTLTITAAGAPVVLLGVGPAGPPAPVLAVPAGPDAPAAGTPETQAVTPEQTPANQAPVELEDEQTPLAAGTGYWALLNLIIAVLALLLAVVLLVGVFSRRRKEEAEEQNGEETEENKGKTGLLWRILAIIAGVLAPIAFFLTENIRNTMTFVDNWTLLMVILLAVQLVLMLILRKARQPKDQDDEERQTPAQA